jgi:LuxR family transcriptional regulator, maltose regulon positive regulatory protein
MTDPAVVQTKLTPPWAPPVIVSRPRLHARLSAHPGRLALVSAPAGFGKTVLVLDWLASDAVPTAWLSLDRFDNDPARFLAHLAAAVSGLDVPGADRAASLIGGLAPGTGPLPAGLLEALAEMGTEPVIVLDDVHELESASVLSVLERLVQVPGPRPRLVLLTRIDPPLPMGRLRVGGELLELRERDLRFTEEEAVQLFDRLLPGVVDATLVERLEQRTEGWIAGLRMAAIALQDAADPAAVVASFAGTHRFVVDYLLEEAVERQDEAVQRFLMDTAILRRFTAETCAAVCGDAGAVARLAEVEAANLFLVSLGSDRRWYRYHHLFAELLQFRLRRHAPERLDLLHARASSWFEAQGDIHAALEHASLMADPRRLLELLDTHALDMLARSEVATVRAWLDRVPDLLSQPYPMVLGVTGWLRVLTDRAPDLQPVLDATAAALERVPPEYDPVRKRRATVQLDMLAAFAARYDWRLEEALEISARVLADPSDDDVFTRGLAVFNLSRVHMALAEMEPAGTLLQQAFEDNLRAGNLYLVLTSLGQGGAVAAQTEGVPKAAGALTAAVTFAEEHGLAGLPAFSTVLYHMGHVHYLADDLDRAEHEFGRAVELGRATGFPEGHANGLVGLARVAVARRGLEEAGSLLHEAAALAQARNAVLLDTTVALEQTRLAIARELAGIGPPVSPIEPDLGDGRWTTLREAELILAIWQALRSERFDAARTMAARLQRESESRNRGPALCSALLALSAIPGEEDRWQILDRVLRLAASRGYLRPLLNGGEAVRALLQAGLTRPLSPAARIHARVALERFDAHAPLDGSTPAPVLVEPLTEREEEVLGYLFHGLSNKAIARAMFVSVETVKTHLKHLYGKLGAADRKDAVARARELGHKPGSRIGQA